MLGPIAFQQQMLKRKLWEKQKAICRAVVSKRSVAVKGCHGSGKTFTVSGLVPYEILSDPEAVVLTIAPTLRQVKTFWGDIIGSIKALPIADLPDPTTTAWSLGSKNYALGFSSSKGVNAQGFHGKRVLILADEAIGISPDLWDAIEGIRSAGDVRLVKLCNPTVPSGPVFEDFTRGRGVPGHECITISAFDTPNLAGLTIETLLQLPEEDLDYAPFPWLTRRRWVKEMYFKWGPTNPRFQSRVLGEFPTQATDAVFHLDWIERAAKPYEPEELKPHVRAGMFIQVGLDVAGPGDDETTAAARLGPFVIARDSWSKADALDEVLLFLASLLRRFPEAALIVVGDTVGIGYHFMRAIARQGFDVRAFIAGAAPIDPVMFTNAKAEQYWELRGWMKDGFVRGIEDEDTQAQLCDIRYRETTGGRIEIEHKDEARARGSSSPDRAEALVMAFAKVVPKQQTMVFGGEGSYVISPI